MVVRKNSKGFTTLEMLLLAGLIVIVAVIGWFAYKNHNKSIETPVASTSTNSSTTTNTDSNSANSTTQNVPTDPTASWKTYTDKSGFSFKYPSDYSVYFNFNNGNIDVDSGQNIVEISSYKIDKEGNATGMRCASHGYDVPKCEVKLEFYINENTTLIDSSYYPDNSDFKSTAKLIIASYKPKK